MCVWCVWRGELGLRFSDGGLLLCKHTVLGGSCHAPADPAVAPPLPAACLPIPPPPPPARPPQVREGTQAQGAHRRHPLDLREELGRPGPRRAPGQPAASWTGREAGQMACASKPAGSAWSIQFAAPLRCCCSTVLPPACPPTPRHTRLPAHCCTDGHCALLHRQARAACGARKGRGRGRHRGLLHAQGGLAGRAGRLCWWAGSAPGLPVLRWTGPPVTLASTLCTGAYLCHAF